MNEYKDKITFRFWFQCFDAEKKAHKRVSVWEEPPFFVTYYGDAHPYKNYRTRCVIFSTDNYFHKKFEILSEYSCLIQVLVNDEWKKISLTEY